jgi:hypothetical protein
MKKKLLFLMTLALMGWSNVWATDYPKELRVYVYNTSTWAEMELGTLTETTEGLYSGTLPMNGYQKFFIYEVPDEGSWSKKFTNTQRQVVGWVDKNTTWEFWAEESEAGMYDFSFDYTAETNMWTCIRNASASTTSVSLTDINGTAWSTYYSDYPFTMPEGVTGYKVSNAENGNLTLTDSYAAGSVVPRWEGVILRSETAGEKTLTYAGVTGDAIGGVLSGSVTAQTINSWGEGDAQIYLYKLANDGVKGFGWYWDSEGGLSLICGANKAYLALTKAQAGYISEGARSFIRMFDNPTGVNDVTAKKEDVKGIYYDLSSRRVMNPTKGLYIVNGKKILK